MVAPGIDFLLNFISALTFDATTPQLIRDDGKDVLFGDVGNDWLVGGTNEDHLYGGYGNDLLQADDNLDSTRVDGDGHVRVAQGAHRAVRDRVHRRRHEGEEPDEDPRRTPPQPRRTATTPGSSRTSTSSRTRSGPRSTSC